MDMAAHRLTFFCIYVGHLTQSCLQYRSLHSIEIQFVWIQVRHLVEGLIDYRGLIPKNDERFQQTFSGCLMHGLGNS